MAGFPLLEWHGWMDTWVVFLVLPDCAAPRLEHLWMKEFMNLSAVTFKLSIYAATSAQ